MRPLPTRFLPDMPPYPRPAFERPAPRQRPSVWFVLAVLLGVGYATFLVLGSIVLLAYIA